MREENQEIWASTDAVLKRMRKAEQEGKGVRISSKELKYLSLTLIGQWWSDPDLDEETK